MKYHDVSRRRVGSMCPAGEKNPGGVRKKSLVRGETRASRFFTRTPGGGRGWRSEEYNAATGRRGRYGGAVALMARRPLPTGRWYYRLSIKDNQILRRTPASFLVDKVVLDLLALAQGGQACALDSRYVDKSVLRAVFGLDKAIALGGIEPFNGADSHNVFSQSGVALAASIP